MAVRRAIDGAAMDISHCRKDFPILSQQMNGQPLAFLDTGASAQKPQVVIDAMSAIMEGGYSNIHRGLYEISQNLTESFEAVRVDVARFINAPDVNTIVFTRNTTEAINLVSRSWGRFNLQKDDEIILTRMEHHANIVPWQLLQHEIGFKIKIIEINERGELDFEHFERLLSHKTRFIGLIHTSNALGTINPVKKMIEMAKDFYKDIVVLVDGSQSIVHGAVDVQDLGADFFSFTGHKLYGPTGVGVLYGRNALLADMPPYQGGGDMIDRVSFDGTSYREAPYRFEAGTPAIVEVIGLGAAIKYLENVGMENVAAHEAELLAYGTQKLFEIEGLTMHGMAANKTGIMSFTMDCAHASDIAMVLDQCGVAVRSGHHCCMPLMEKLGVDATVRASLGLYSNKADIDQLVEGLHKVKGMFG